MSVLDIRDLTVAIGDKKVIDGVSISLEPGRITALVGESGSGKTLTALAILDLLPGAANREKGEMVFKGRDMFRLDGEGKRKIRGNDIAMVFQEPFTALNPVMRVGDQIAETIRAHTVLNGPEIHARIGDLMELVKLLPDVTLQYPHELSGGMRQRVLLAMAMSCSPEALILDEPTTALDVSIQKHVLDLIKSIQREKGLTILFITHDFSVVNMIADEVCVMKDGSIVEAGAKEKVLRFAEHPYTRQLIECIPRLGDRRERLPVGGS